MAQIALGRTLRMQESGQEGGVFGAAGMQFCHGQVEGFEAEDPRFAERAESFLPTGGQQTRDPGSKQIGVDTETLAERPTRSQGFLHDY